MIISLSEILLSWNVLGADDYSSIDCCKWIYAMKVVDPNNEEKVKGMWIISYQKSLRERERVTGKSSDRCYAPFNLCLFVCCFLT